MKAKQRLVEILMKPSKHKETNVNFGIVNEFKARYLAQKILEEYVRKDGEDRCPECEGLGHIDYPFVKCPTCRRR